MRLLLGAISLVPWAISAEASTMCPDGSYVGGSTCVMAPDGSYVSGGQSPSMAPDGTFTSGPPRNGPKWKIRRRKRSRDNVPRWYICDRKLPHGTQRKICR